MARRSTEAGKVIEACLAVGQAAPYGCTFDTAERMHQVRDVKFLGLDFRVSDTTLVISGRQHPKQLVELVDIKAHPILECDRVLPLDFFDPIFGSVVSVHDYLARWIMMTTPDLWSTWETAAQQLINDVKAGRSKKPRVSGNDVGPLVRAKFSTPSVVGEPYQVTNNYTSFYMKLFKIVHQADAAYVSTRTSRVDDRIDSWVQDGTLLKPV